MVRRGEVKSLGTCHDGRVASPGGGNDAARETPMPFLEVYRVAV
jgi:hypothetical protein